MTKKNSTLIVVVLDRSGSMESVRGATIEGFGKFLHDQKKLPGEARMTLIQFDDMYEQNYIDAPLDAIRLEYTPRGGTALLDAMGRTIYDVGVALDAKREKDRPSKVVFVTITDGFENASRLYTRDRIFDMISHQRSKYGWEFLFLGANQDAIAAGASMGIPSTHSMSYDPSRVGTRSAYGTMSNSIGSARMGGSSQITNKQRQAYNTETGTKVAEAPVEEEPDSSGLVATLATAAVDLISGLGSPDPTPPDTSSTPDSGDFSGGGGGESGGGGASGEV